MKTAIKAIAGGMKISQAPKDYNIPRMTLSDHWKKSTVSENNSSFNI